MRRARLRGVALAVGLVLAAGGCIQIGGDAVPDARRHALDDADAAAVASDAPAADFDATLGVPLFDARARYGMRVVATDDDDGGTVTLLEFERWVEDPRDGLTDVVREALAESGAFRSVQRADSGLGSDLELRGFIKAYDLVRAGGGSRARLRLRLTLSDRRTDEVLHTAVFQAERPVPGPDTTGLGRAMTECAGDVASQALAAWAAILK